MAEMEKEISCLEKNLGYSFRDRSLLLRALTHPSRSREDNQRLEFLGDAVLEFVISDILYANYPDDQEGALTRSRQLLVDEVALAQIAKTLQIGQALLMSHGEELTGGRENPSVLCDAMEAVLAAVYLDGGLEPVRTIVKKHWPRPENIERPLLNSKGALQELVQHGGGEAPRYEIVEQSGPPHDRQFIACVYLKGKEMARGQGRTKQQAEQQAARAAIVKLRGGEE